MHRGRPGMPYGAVCAISIEGELQDSVLAAALTDLKRRHEILRTGFVSLPGMLSPVQVVCDDTKPMIGEIDLRGMEDEARDAEISSLLQRARIDGLDLGSGSPFQVMLAAFSTARRLLIISLPALCADAGTLSKSITKPCK